MMTTGLVMHVDMDAFFASVEQRDYPEYRGRPVVVGALPGGRGVVATCSYEARTFGIHSAMPISEAHRRCPDAVYLRPRMKCYARVSRQVMQALEGVSPVVEPVSIDEAYVDISGLDRLIGSPEEIGRKTKTDIRGLVGLTASVGIGPNRLIAKLASDYRKPDGLTVVLPDAVAGFLGPMPVGNLRGVGPQTRKIADRLGIRRVAQLRGYPLELLKMHFGDKAGVALYEQARGMASAAVGARSARKSISKETTFDADVSDERLLRTTLRELASQVGRTARREGLTGALVTLKIRLAGFETHSRQRRLQVQTNRDGEIFRAGWDLYRSSNFVGRPVRLIGVGISGWKARNAQTDLFVDPDKQAREKKLYDTLDTVTDLFGEGKLSLGMGRRDSKK
jgi:DNA polymerase-4